MVGRDPLKALRDPARGLNRERCEELLGEKIVVPDPWITTAQAARVLGIQPEQVRRLVHQGWLHQQAPSRLARRFLLSEILELNEPIPVMVAADLIGCDWEEVIALLDSGRFRRTGDPLLQARRVDAMLERGRRRRPGPGRPARRTPGPSATRQQPRPRPVPALAKQVDDDGLIGLREAAQVLVMSEDWTLELARAGRIPAERGAQGRWRFSAAKLQLVVNAWRTASAHGRRPPTISRPRRSR